MLTKVCGLTDIKETKYLKDNNVDFAGMVLFYEKSKRNITVEKAREIIAALHDCDCLNDLEENREAVYINAVAVVVSPTVEQAKEIEEAGFDYIQIHGTADEEIYKNLSIPVLKAFNVFDLDNYEYYLSFPNIKGFVFDAGQPGSGKTFDWDMLKQLERKVDKLYILAGGLNASNVEAAIKEVNPDGVDVSSGVEFEDRLGKDSVKITEFIRLAKSVQ